VNIPTQAKIGLEWTTGLPNVRLSVFYCHFVADRILVQAINNFPPRDAYRSPVDHAAQLYVVHVLFNSPIYVLDFDVVVTLVRFCDFHIAH
jgi:hypothetical protein